MYTQQEFDKKIKEWLCQEECFDSHISWQLSDLPEQDSVAIYVFLEVKLTFGNMVKTRKIEGQTTTRRKEDSIHNAVIALNKDLMKHKEETLKEMEKEAIS